MTGELQLTGEGGFLPEMIKAVLERGLAAELTDHLGYEKGDPAGPGSPELPQRLHAEDGGDRGRRRRLWTRPRDRAGSFEPRLVPKGARRVGGLDEMIISLYAGGMTVRDIQAHLARTIGTELSHETISKITDAVLDEVKAWQARPLEEIYPIMYLDALVVKVRDGHQVRNKAAHIAVGVDLDGVKHVLGIWVQATEGAKFWAGVCAELANRGVRDVLIVCCDGLTGSPRSDRSDLAPNHGADLCGASDPGCRCGSCPTRTAKPSPTALQADLHRPDRRSRRDRAVGALRVRTRSAGTRPRWRPGTNAWERFIPFLEFPPEVRKIIYTTNAIESLNYQLRKIIKNRGHFPNDDAVIKLLWLAIRDIEDKRARQRAKEAGKTAEANAKPQDGSSKAPPSTAGKQPSTPSPSPTPTASPTTSTNNPSLLHRKLDRPGECATRRHPGRDRVRRLGPKPTPATPQAAPGPHRRPTRRHARGSPERRRRAR